MTRALFPAVETRFVFPLVILAAQNHGVLHPHQILFDLPARLLQGRPEIEALAVRVEDVIAAAGLQGPEHLGVKVVEEKVEGAVIHAVVLNRQGIGGLSNIVHIIGRVGDAQVHLDTAGQQIYIRFIGAVPTKKPVVAKLPKLAALAAGRGGGLRC